MSSIAKEGTTIVIITHSYPDRTKKELLLSIGCVHSLHDDGTAHNIAQLEVPKANIILKTSSQC